MVNYSEDWCDRPCTKCIRKMTSAGLDADTASQAAGRRARLGTYYCQGCINEYQNDRNRSISASRKIRRTDLDEVLLCVERLDSLIVEDRWDVGAIKGEWTLLRVRLEALSRMVPRNEDVPRGRPRKEVGVDGNGVGIGVGGNGVDSGNGVGMGDGLKPPYTKEEALKGLRLALAHRHVNPEVQDPIIRDRRDVLWVYYSYEGPEMQD